MLLIGLGLLAMGLPGAVTAAPVSAVTVYSDRAHVVRTATVTLSGTQRLELPRLREHVDPSSIRVEAQGAEVTHVDVRSISADAFSQDAARKVLARLDDLDAALARNTAEHAAYTAQLEALRLLKPTVRGTDALAERSTARAPASGVVDPAAWSTAASFVVDSVARMEARLRELEDRSRVLALEREQQQFKAAELGGERREPGVEVAATLSGQGPVKVLLTYSTARARWYPRYELQLQPETQRVQVAFSGRVSQETGEDWEGARLTLSTALPATATVLPKLTTWKLGTAERFIPTPQPLQETVRPAPHAPGLPAPFDPEAELREQLLARASGPQPALPGVAYAQPMQVPGEVVSAPPTMDVGATTTGVNVNQDFARRIEANRPGSQGGAPSSSVGLAPPAGWRPPTLDPRSPAALAGGYSLTFVAQRPETVRSGEGERGIPLRSESWPVQVERKVFPALAPDAFLVARLQSPSKDVLPGGEAALFVGADPAGTAMLKTVVPAEPFTLPLGIDRAVRTARNVRLVQAEKGLLSKDDVGTYEVTIEVPNPYPFPLPVSVVDQWPLNSDGKVEVALVRTEPFAKQAPDKGELRWDLVVPASAKSTVSFQYTLRRPKGWRLTQQQP